MTPYELLVQVDREKRQAQIPAMLDPLRKAGKRLGNAMSSARPHTNQQEWDTLPLEEKIVRAGAYGGSLVGEGAARSIPNMIAGGLSVSPPAQLAQYAMGMPSPMKQLQHAGEGLSGAALFSPLGKSANVGPITGKIFPKGTKWVGGL